MQNFKVTLNQTIKKYTVKYSGTRIVTAKYTYASAVESGYTGTEAEWILSIQGTKGNPGLTPNIGINGNWWLGTADTGVKARATDGLSGKGINSIVKTATNGLIDTYRITYSDNTSIEYSIVNGKDGKNGNEVSTIIKTSTNGLIDTYTITFTDSSKTDFYVTNGKNGIDGITPIKGIDYFDGVTPHIGTNNHWWIGLIDTGIIAQGASGRSITSISRTSGTGVAGTTDTYTISFSDTTSSTYLVVNGANGSPGSNGRGISSIARTTGNGTAGTTDTYTITFTDASTTTFTVVNGANGSYTETAQYVLSGLDAKIELGVKASHTILEAHNFTADKIYTEMTSAPTDYDIIVDVKKNGTSIFSTKPKISVGNLHKTINPVLVTSPTVFSVGDIRTVTVDQVGGSETGKNLVLSILMNKTI